MFDDSRAPLASLKEIDSEADAVEQMDRHGNANNMPARMSPADGVKHSTDPDLHGEDEDV
jgi:hypothetical protein